jgi:UDP-2-acetamido-3-amino-2,3-dideoxy-glucuronate N-acetyltransferase
VKPAIALIGAGYWGSKILSRLHALGVLHTVAVQNLNKYTDLAAKYPGPRWTTNLNEVWSNPDIVGVVIATPAPTHAALVEAALRSYKHVLCEKPLSMDLATARRLAELAQQHQRHLLVGHILRYHPAIQKIHQLIGQGLIGEIRSIHSQRMGFGKYPLNEDVLWGLAIHDLDLIPWLIGENPQKTHIDAPSPIAGKLLDTVSITLRFAEGRLGQIEASWTFPQRMRTLTITGTSGVLILEDLYPTPRLFFHAIHVRWMKGTVPHLTLDKVPESIPFDSVEPLMAELQHFLACVEGRETPRTPVEATLPAIALAEKLSRQVYPDTVPTLPYFVHPTALIDEDVEIGEGTKIWHFSHVLRGSRIGKNCVLGQNVVVGPFVKVGHNCKIQNNVSLYYGVELEDGVLCGPSCVFTNDKYPRAFIERRNEFLQTRVRRGATIGANATVMCGVTIGQFAMVGAGAVVTQDVPDHALVVGNPARQVGWVCTCGETLSQRPDGLWHCPRCDSLYQETLKGLALHNSSVTPSSP